MDMRGFRYVDLGSGVTQRAFSKDHGHAGSWKKDDGGFNISLVYLQN